MRRKAIGYILVAIGLAMLLFVAYTYFTQRSGLVSPIPDDKGVKVIYK